MLIKCPECELQISDKASSCPHCGYPMVKETKSGKRKRLPNGFGQISYMKGHNLRNKYRAMVTVGKTDTGRPIVKSLKPQTYFPTYNDAYYALLEYHKSPYDLTDCSMTIKELYDKWSEEYFKKLTSSSSERTIRSAWSYCESVYDVYVRDFRTRHLKGVIEECPGSENIKSRIKSLFNMLMDYALEYELTDKNYARNLKISIDRSTVKEHIPYTDSEMETLWEHVDTTENVDMILIQCYTGWRPQELCNIKLSDIEMIHWTMTGGMKTKAGKNRLVPIHPRIRGLVARRIEEARNINSEWLFNRNGHMTYDKYQKVFKKIVSELGLDSEHRCHDARKHFVTMAKKYQVDEYAIKYIIGHAITDLTENTYTKRDMFWLIEEMKKIP